MDKRTISIQKGKIPPQAVDVEEAVIGAALIDRKAVDDAMEVLKPEYFYELKHQELFSVISSLHDSNSPIDLLTISKKLTERGKLELVGGDYHLIQLSQKVASGAHTEYHARIIQQMWIKRKMISLASDIIEMAYDPKQDVFDILDSAGSYFDGINDALDTSGESMSWSDAMKAIIPRVEFLTNKGEGEITGIPTGIDACDVHFSGWQKEDFIVIGADSGMGKTAFVMNNMLASAKQGRSVGMFSMEMSVVQLATRAMAVHSSFHMNQLMRSGFEKEEYFTTLMNYVEELKDLPIFIDDKPALTVQQMKRKARSLKRKHDIELLVIDFIQMFSGDKEIRINVGEAARECKNLAKELKIPVIALSQLSREVRKSRFQLPKKYHLKEASAIEEAADVIGMLYRPEYYGYTQISNPDLYKELGLIGEENAVLIVEKNRNGSLGNVGLKYIENKTKFVNSYSPDYGSIDEDDSPF